MASLNYGGNYVNDWMIVVIVVNSFFLIDLLCNLFVFSIKVIFESKKYLALEILLQSVMGIAIYYFFDSSFDHTT